MIMISELNSRACKGYLSYEQLFQAIAHKIRSAQECLIRVGYKKVLPILKKKNKGIDLDKIEDGLIIGLAKFITLLENNEQTQKYSIVKFGLLLTVCYRSVIDIIRKKDEDIRNKDRVEDWEEYTRRTQSADSYCDQTEIVDENAAIDSLLKFKKSLTKDEALVYELYYEEHVKVKEIAKIMEKSENAVYRNIEEIIRKKIIFSDKVRRGEI